MDTDGIHPSDEELNSWLKHGQWDRVKSYLALLSDNQYHAMIWLAKGLLQAYGPAADRNPEQAVLCLEKACEMAPEEIRYLNTLSEVLLQSGAAERALEVAKTAGRLFPDNSLAAIARGRAALACGDKQDAYLGFQSALDQMPEDSPVRRQIHNIAFGLAPFWWQDLVGKSVRLVRMNRSHKDFLLSCRNDNAFRHHYNLFQKASPELVEKDLKRAEKSPVETNKIEWVVEKDGRAIGLAALVDLNLKNSRAEILVGFPGQTSGLVSVEATLLVLEYAFSVLGLCKVYSYVYSDNPNGQRNTEHLGFEREGLLRSHVFDPESEARLDLNVNACFPDLFFNNVRLMKMAARLLGRTPEPGNQVLR